MHTTSCNNNMLTTPPTLFPYRPTPYHSTHVAFESCLSDLHDCVVLTQLACSQPIHIWVSYILTTSQRLETLSALNSVNISGTTVSLTTQIKLRGVSISLLPYFLSSHTATQPHHICYLSFKVLSSKQSCPRVTFLGPDPTRRNFDPTKSVTRSDPTRDLTLTLYV